jgi:ribonuclease VapC
MIVVDTSALMAILRREPEAEDCRRAIATEDDVRISAVTLAEALIVADSRGSGIQMRMLVKQLGIEVVPVTAVRVEHVAEANQRWGKGHHPAGLNFGDCFAYALAKELVCPLVFIGNDFARTDVARASTITPDTTG